MPRPSAITWQELAPSPKSRTKRTFARPRRCAGFGAPERPRRVGTHTEEETGGVALRIVLACFMAGDAAGLTVDGECAERLMRLAVARGVLGQADVEGMLCCVALPIPSMTCHQRSHYERMSAREDAGALVLAAVLEPSLGKRRLGEVFDADAKCPREALQGVDGTALCATLNGGQVGARDIRGGSQVRSRHAPQLAPYADRALPVPHASSKGDGHFFFVRVLADTAHCFRIRRIRLCFAQLALRQTSVRALCRRPFPFQADEVVDD